MAYRLFVKEQDGIFSSLKDAAASLRNLLGQEPVEFTVQCFDSLGRFYYGFGGRVEEGEIKYNGWTANNQRAKTAMRRFKRYAKTEQPAL